MTTPNAVFDMADFVDFDEAGMPSMSQGTIRNNPGTPLNERYVCSPTLPALPHLAARILLRYNQEMVFFNCRMVLKDSNKRSATH
jgi:hypothetical protein